MKKSLIALAFGTLGLGIAEFVMMGILPDVAKDLGISIPTAGHFISAYALGVCVGAPVLTLARKYPLKHILLVLVTLIMIGNICAAMAPNYWVLLIARFISGLPHGAYFGVGSIVAERLADKGKGSEAVSIMIAGMTIANLFGVPLGTSLSTMLSWRVTFLLVGIWGIVILYYIWRWVPHVEGLEDTGFKGQFRFLRTPAPWLILGATALGNGGVFCWYSYINPMLTNVSGFSVADYAYTCEKLDAQAQVGWLEVNVSCPNVHGGGMSFGTDPRAAAEVTKAVKAVTAKPVIVKLSPNVTDIVSIAKACEDAGADGISLINTMLGMRIDLRRRKPVIANTMGGYSGPGIFPVAVRMVYQVAHAVKIPVIGMGGVQSAEDVLEMMLAGATAVEVGAANLVDPWACKKIIEDLPRVMENYRIENLSDIIGGAQ